MKLKKTIVAVLSFVMIVGSAICVFAASRSFSVDFKHQVALNGEYKATQESADFSFTATYKGTTDSIIEIQQYHANLIGGDSYLGSTEIGCGIDEECYASFSTDVGTKYTYEFWKSTDGGYIRGDGTINY